MSDVPPIVVYKAINAPSEDLTFLAAFYGSGRGEIVPYNFCADTPEAARLAAEDWWKGRRTQFVKAAAIKASLVSPEGEEETQIVKPSSGIGAGRGAGNIGSIWIVNVKNERRRIKIDEFPEYEAKGFIKGKLFNK